MSVREEGKRLRGVREGGKAKEGKGEEGREREFGPPTFQMLPPPMRVRFCRYVTKLSNRRLRISNSLKISEFSNSTPSTPSNTPDSVISWKRRKTECKLN